MTTAMRKLCKRDFCENVAVFLYGNTPTVEMKEQCRLETEVSDVNAKYLSV